MMTSAWNDRRDSDLRCGCCSAMSWLNCLTSVMSNAPHSTFTAGVSDIRMTVCRSTCLCQPVICYDRVWTLTVDVQLSFACDNALHYVCWRLCIDCTCWCWFLWNVDFVSSALSEDRSRQMRQSRFCLYICCNWCLCLCCCSHCMLVVV